MLSLTFHSLQQQQKTAFVPLKIMCHENFIDTSWELSYSHIRSSTKRLILRQFVQLPALLKSTPRIPGGFSPVEIEENVVELFEEKEASSHALATGYGVAFACTPPHLCKLCLDLVCRQIWTVFLCLSPWGDFS